MSAATIFQTAGRGRESSLDCEARNPFSAVAVRLDPEDLRAVAITFVATAGLVLVGAFVFDSYLLAVLSRPVSLDGLLTYRLAIDMLPWACSFTCVACAAIATGVLALTRTFAGSDSDQKPGFLRAVRR